MVDILGEKFAQSRIVVRCELLLAEMQVLTILDTFVGESTIIEYAL